MAACVAAAALGRDADGRGRRCGPVGESVRTEGHVLHEDGTAATEDPIKVVQIRSQLEKYEPLGCSLPVGNVNDMFQVFTDQINECGGIRAARSCSRTRSTTPPTRPAATPRAHRRYRGRQGVCRRERQHAHRHRSYCVAGHHKTPLVYVGGALSPRQGTRRIASSARRPTAGAPARRRSAPERRAEGQEGRDRVRPTYPIRSTSAGGTVGR